MKDKYVIIDKTEFLKELDRLKKRSQLGLTDEEWNNERGQEAMIERVLSQSIPLTPEIEKAFDAGVDKIDVLEPREKDKQEYISNLKLNI